MKKTVLIGATCALLGGAGAAGAQTSHILGHDGPTVPLTVKCQRAVVPPPGETLEMSVNVIGQQVHCLIRRADPFAQCVKRLGPAPAVSVWHKDDWKGVGALRNYVAALGACSKAHL